MCAYIGCNRCDFHIGSLIDGKYSVDRSLGEGTFGKVFRVKRISDSKIFALKLLKLWTVESLEREKLLKRFDQEYETGRIDCHEWKRHAEAMAVQDSLLAKSTSDARN